MEHYKHVIRHIVERNLAVDEKELLLKEHVKYKEGMRAFKKTFSKANEDYEHLYSQSSAKEILERLNGDLKHIADHANRTFRDLPTMHSNEDLAGIVGNVMGYAVALIDTGLPALEPTTLDQEASVLRSYLLLFNNFITMLVDHHRFINDLQQELEHQILHEDLPEEKRKRIIAFADILLKH